MESVYPIGALLTVLQKRQTSVSHPEERGEVLGVWSLSGVFLEFRNTEQSWGEHAKMLLGF